MRFASFSAGAEAVRAISQAGLHPSNCRLIDAAEAALTSGGDGEHALLVLGFESADHELHAWMDRALELCAAAGGEWDEVRDGSQGRSGAVGAWREAFLRAPYLRDTFVAMGVLSETFETAITWDRLDGFLEAAMGAAREAVREVCGAGTVTVRFTHVYPDGPAPYFTILAPARRGEELEQWAADQGRGLRRGDRRRGHDHPPPRRRPRPPSLVRPPASRALRPGAARGQDSGRPARGSSTPAC